MDWLVWVGALSVFSGAGLFAFGMRRDPLMAAGVSGGATLMTTILLFLFWSKSPAGPSTISADATSDETPEPVEVSQKPDKTEAAPPAAKTEEPAEIAPAKPEPVANGSVDLLSRIELPRDQITGNWTLENGVLTAPMFHEFKPTKVSIPVRPPESFQLVAEVERIQGNDSISFGVPVGGQDIVVCVDGYDVPYSGINLINRSTADRNESRRRGPFLTDGRPNTIVLSVGPNSVHLTVDGKTAVDWQGDVRRLSLDQRWPRGPLGQIEISTWRTSFRITKLELKPLP